MPLIPRLKARLGSLFASAEDPRHVSVSVYQRQLELLQRLRSAIGEVSASKQQLEAQTERMKAKLPDLQEHARRALVAGREDLARLTLQRRRAAIAELRRLESQAADVAQEEQRLALAEQRLAAQIEAFHARQEVISARYTAAEAQVRINEALAGVSKELTALGVALEQAEAKTEHMQARASAIDELMEAGVLEDGSIGAPDRVDRVVASRDDAVGLDREIEELKRQVANGPRETKDFQRAFTDDGRHTSA